MANSVVKFTAPGAVASGLADAFAAADAERPVQTSGQPYLKLRKNDGLWVYGQEQVECSDDTDWMIGASTFMQGFIDWHGGKPAGERMVYMGQGPVPSQSDLGPAQGKDGWKAQVGFHLIGVGGEDDGQELIWKTNTHGGIAAWNLLFDAIKARLGAGKPDFNPVVSLGSDNYVHPEYGLIFKPDILVMRWVDEGGNEVAAAAAKIEQDAAKTGGRKRRAKTPA